MEPSNEVTYETTLTPDQVEWRNAAAQEIGSAVSWIVLEGKGSFQGEELPEGYVRAIVHSPNIVQFPIGVVEELAEAENTQDT